MSNFVICIHNENNPASLIVGKVYRRLPDADADAEMDGMIRIIDEDTSEPDGYLYSSSIFVPIELPEMAEQALMAIWIGQNDEKAIALKKRNGEAF
jgi:hypothetical protein